MKIIRIRIALAVVMLAAAAAAGAGVCAAEDQKPANPVAGAPEYNAENVRDPFQSWLVKEQVQQLDIQPAGPVEPEVIAPLPEMEVQGVFWDGSFPVAIINNVIVKEGDSVHDAKVMNITQGNIRLFYANREFNIPSPANHVTKK